MVLNEHARTVTVDAGIRYAELGRFLTSHGYALRNLASLPHISVVGACVTATHGSGDSNGCLATEVQGFELMTGSGETVQFSREADGDLFDGLVVNLGSIGIITRLSLSVIPVFEIAQRVYFDLPLQELYANFDAITSSAYSVSLFTNWQSGCIDQVWLKDITTAGSPSTLETFFGAREATRDMHPVGHLPAHGCTPQLGVPGAWNDRLPHFRVEHTPSVGEELQTEYFVPREQAPEALRRLFAMQATLAPLIQISEIRTVAADTLWLSPCYGRASVGIHFTWKNQLSDALALLPKIERMLADLEPRPHWAKLFTMEPAVVRAQYPRLPEFLREVKAIDSGGQLSNEFLKTYIL
jgi:xylitol oxidase